MVLVPTLESDDELRSSLSSKQQQLFDSLLPAEGPDVTLFLMDAAFAINGRESDLARVQGVSRSTIATWKKRGIIPAKHLRWFQQSLLPAALVAPRWRSGLGWGSDGLPIVLTIFDQTDFNPYDRVFATRTEQIEASRADMFGLVNIGQLVASRAQYGHRQIGDHRDVSGYLAPFTLELARVARQLIALGEPTPARDKAGNFLWPDGTTTGGTTSY